VLIYFAAEAWHTSSLALYPQRGHDVTVPAAVNCAVRLFVSRLGIGRRFGTATFTRVADVDAAGRSQRTVSMFVINLWNRHEHRKQFYDAERFFWYHEIVKCGITSEGLKCASCFESVSNECGKMMRQDGRQCAAVLHWNELSGSTLILTSQVTISFSTTDVFN
jgi:hypothetical protein